MFRRFDLTIAIGDGSRDNVIRSMRVERLINIRAIESIYRDYETPGEVVTVIKMVTGEVHVSNIDYLYLADALDYVSLRS